MGQPTPRQSQIEAQITQSKQDATLDETESREKLTIDLEEKVNKKLQDKIIVHYTHENRFNSMKKDIHEVFDEAFQSLGIERVRLIVGNRNNPTSQRELIRKRPHMKLMKLKQQR